MIDTHRQQDPTSSNFSSTSTSVSNNLLQNDPSSSSVVNPTVLSSSRPTLRSNRHFLFPIVPAARFLTSPTSPRAGIRDLCLPRQEPRPPADVLNRLCLGSCSPSVARFSHTIISQNVSTSTSTTTLPISTTHSSTFLHPAMAHYTVNNRRCHHYYANPNCHLIR